MELRFYEFIEVLIHYFRMSGLHQAALMGNTEIMELLLENGAAVTIRDNKGEPLTLGRL